MRDGGPNGGWQGVTYTGEDDESRIGDGRRRVVRRTRTEDGIRIAAHDQDRLAQLAQRCAVPPGTGLPALGGEVTEAADTRPWSRVIASRAADSSTG